MRIVSTLIQLPPLLAIALNVVLLPFALSDNGYDFDPLVPYDTGLLIICIVIACFFYNLWNYYAKLAFITLIMLNVCTHLQLYFDFDYKLYMSAYIIAIVFPVFVAVFSKTAEKQNDNMA